MGRTPGTQNVTDGEVKLIRTLYRQGAKLTEIVEDVGRCMSVVERAVRGMKRKRPTPDRGDNWERDQRILQLTEEGMSRAEVGKKVGLKPSRVGHIIKTHPHVAWLLRVRKVRPATVAKRYRMELSTAERIAKGADTKAVPRTRRHDWDEP